MSGTGLREPRYVCALCNDVAPRGQGGFNWPSGFAPPEFDRPGFDDKDERVSFCGPDCFHIMFEDMKRAEERLHLMRLPGFSLEDSE